MAPSQQLKLWELAGDNANLSFSPFVWRVRLTLAYKGLPYEYKAWRFSDKELIQPCKTVPTLDYGDKRLNESLDICKFLEEEFPDTPKLFNTSCEAVYKCLTPEDQKYFRKSREAKFGQTLEKLTGDEAQQAKQKEAVQECLEPMRQTLANNKWLGGNNINYADISVAGVFVFAHSFDLELLTKDDPVYEWRERIFKRFEETISKNGKST